MEFNEIKSKIKKSLDKDRYNHTKGVMYTAACLAMAYDFSIDKAMLAGLLHDCAKNICTEEKIKLCKDNDVLISEVEYLNPSLLHAKAGAILAKEEYEVDDVDILHSIRVHTTGCPDMNLLDKIIFVSDYIEPSRNTAPRLDYIRKLAFQDLNLCVYEILEDTLKYLASKSGAIDSATQLTYDFYAQYKKE